MCLLALQDSLVRGCVLARMRSCESREVRERHLLREVLRSVVYVCVALGTKEGSREMSLIFTTDILL